MNSCDSPGLCPVSGIAILPGPYPAGNADLVSHLEIVDIQIGIGLKHHPQGYMIAAAQKVKCVPLLYNMKKTVTAAHRKVYLNSFLIL